MMTDVSQSKAPAAAATSKPMPRWQAALEAIGLSVLLVPSIILVQVILFFIGYDSVALPSLGVYIVVALASWLLWRRGDSWSALGFRRSVRTVSTLVRAFGATMGIMVISAARQPLMHRAGLPPADLSYFLETLPGNTVLYLEFMILIVWGSAAFGEELFARGFLLNRMERLFSGLPGALFWAVTAQGAVFGLAHAYQGPAGIILTATVGFFLGWVYIICGRNLWVPILAHGLFDTFGITAIYLGYANM